jgi:hypothetical protein
MNHKELLLDLLIKRGYSTPELQDRFLNPNYDLHIYDPFLLSDMQKGIERICTAMINDEKICVYHDYDADGIPGAVVMHDFFKKIGYKNVMFYIPHLNQIAAVAVALKEANTTAFQKYAKQVVKNAKVLASELAKLGWRIISGGTDSHLVLVDTWMNGRGISGKEASDRLEKEGIIVNKNTIPNETRSPMDPSGIRLGSAAETTRGKKEKDFINIARKIDKILRKK